MKIKASHLRIAMVAAKWHYDLVKIATDGCHSRLIQLGISEKHMEHFRVPGSLELPLTSKLLARSGQWDAIIAFGLIVDGGIYRHEFVAQAVIDGLVKAAMETDIPVLSVVLSPQHFDEQDENVLAMLRKHLVGKGTEAADAAIQIIQVDKPLRHVG